MIRRILIGACVGLPVEALACAVCFAGEERSRTAFLVTTVLLAVLPFLLAGGIAWLLRRDWSVVEMLDEPSPPRAER